AIFMDCRNRDHDGSRGSAALRDPFSPPLDVYRGQSTPGFLHLCNSVLRGRPACILVGWAPFDQPITSCLGSADHARVDLCRTSDLCAGGSLVGPDAELLKTRKRWYCWY